jgi:hypothetical protein
MESYGGMSLTEKKTSNPPTRALLQSYQQSHPVANQEEVSEENDEFRLQSIYIHTSK